MKFIFILFAFFLFIFSVSLDANEVSGAPLPMDLQELKEMVGALQGTVKDLQTAVLSQNEVIQKQVLRINALEEGKIEPAVGTGLKPVPTGREIKGISQGLNPDIGVVGTVQANLTESGEDGEGRDTIALKEIELNFAQYVDPYSRLDAVLSFNDALEAQNTEIEEAYYTHWGLPLGFYGQLGKFRSKIGKQNLLHLDQLPTTDYPLVIQDFFGEEGLASSGARLQNNIPNPWDVPLEITGEVLRGNNGNSFSGISRRPIFNTHLKSFFEVTEDSNLELGWTTLFGDENPRIRSIADDGTEIITTLPEGQDRYGVKVFGADMTLNWLLPENKTLKWQSEAYFQNRGPSPRVNKDPWGFYSLVDYRFSPKFSAGLRFDYVEPLNVKDEHGRTTGISPYITFWQSEFANFRLQYSHADPASADAKADDAIYLQANFLIGSHKHPVQ